MKRFGEVLENVNLKEYSTFGIGGKAKYLVKPTSVENLENLIKFLKDNNTKYYVLGNGSNVIIDDNDFNGVVIKLDNLNNVIFDENIVTAEGGLMLPILVNKCLEQSLIGLSFAAMIPGTVGGSVVGNAGAYGSELMQYVKSVKVINPEGEIHNLDKDEISYGYRYTSLKDKYIVLSADFILKKGDALEEKQLIQERRMLRTSTQPLTEKNVGSIFRNPENNSAGKLIDELGLKGYAIGGAKISEKHANFIVNTGNATFNDVINLINYIKDEVKKKYDINLVLEPTIIRWNEI